MDLLTERLKVRTFELGDVAQAWAYLADPDVMRHIQAPFDLAATRAFIQGAGITGNLVHAVVCRSTPRLLGHLIWTHGSHLPPGKSDGSSVRTRGGRGSLPS